MNAFRIIVAAFIAAISAPALATTDCTGTVYSIWHETAAGALCSGQPCSYAQLNSATGKGFTMSVTDPGYKGVFAAMHQAQITGSTVMLRFAASGVNCSTYEWRNDLTIVTVFPN